MESTDTAPTEAHPIAGPLHALVAAAVGAGQPPEHIVDAILVLLSDFGMARYSPKGTLSILTLSGRVLVALLEKPDSTLREMALYLGSSETQVSHAVSALVRSKLVTRTKVGIRNHYALNVMEAIKHPDIVRLLRAVLTGMHAKPTDIRP